MFNFDEGLTLRRKFILHLLGVFGLTIVFIFCYLCVTPTCVYKPAIYLYSKKPIEVNIKLDKSIEYSTTIPQYVPEKGWNVRVENNKITDLQPEYTDCKVLDKNEFGLEYAQKACTENNYPYIFWDGVQRTKSFLNTTKGWIVKKVKIKGFLEQKADLIGFNRQEKSEFVRYWTKKLSDIDSEYFHIYFLQNAQVNSYLPIKVKPVPDSYNRVLIIAKPLKSVTKKEIEPQHLVKISRKGFTLVEWGGVVKK